MQQQTGCTDVTTVFQGCLLAIANRQIGSTWTLSMHLHALQGNRTHTHTQEGQPVALPIRANSLHARCLQGKQPADTLA